MGIRYNADMAPSSRVSTYDRINAMVKQLQAAVSEREQMDEHSKVVGLIESGKHVLAGAKALATYLEPRFTADMDYVVEGRTFEKVRKWLVQEHVPHEDLGGAIRAQTIGLDIINGDGHPVLKEILKRERGIPSPEALAATKYVSIVSGTRGQQKLYLDISDFVGLVTLSGFGVEKFVGYLVDRFEEQRPHARELIEKIKSGEGPITIYGGSCRRRTGGRPAEACRPRYCAGNGF
jgi:hypothetical protein